MIDRATIEKIKDTADIVDVVSDYVHLTRRGANYMGLCPFHNERTPSFSVNKSRNFCYCFSCHKGGSPVNFIMEKEGLSYHQALLHLAKKYGIEVQEKELSPAEQAARDEREAMLVVNEWAATAMSANLTETEDGKAIGLSYLYGRGITAEAVSKFRLGYAIDNGQALVDSARKSGFNLDTLVALGLLGKSQEGRLYDRFRGRVIFPILNASGKVIAFGGRDLKGGPAKYINSPESTLYKKSNELYGIYQAKSEIVRQDKCFLVEGYLDVIGMWQSGLKNVVASSGTALTDGQIALIHRFTNKITLLYDGDAAGIKASLRGIDMLLKHRMEVKVLLLPDGHDPDSFARSRTADEFRKYIEENETDIIRFQTKVLLDEAGRDPQRRIAAANSVVRSISSIPDQISRAVYIQECARVFSIDEASVTKAVSLAITENEIRYQKEKEAERRRQENNSRIQSTSGPDVGTAPGHSASTSEAEEEMDYYGRMADREASRNGGEVSPAGNETPKKDETSGSAGVLSAVGSSIDSISDKRRGIVQRLESEVIRYCVRLGLTNFCCFKDENGNEITMNVVEFVQDELRNDGVEFSNPTYRKILGYLLQSGSQLERGLEKFRNTLEEEIAAMRRERIDEISRKSISMQGLELAEKKMEEELEEHRVIREKEFIRDFSGRILASHEEDDIRRTATELLYERNQLSRIYTKEMKRSDLTKEEENRASSGIVRSINELKNEVIEQQYLQKMNELKSAVASNAGTEEIMGIQMEISKLIRMRKTMAKNLGDRTLSS